MAVSPESAPVPAWTSPHGRPLPRPGKRTLVMGIVNVTPDSFSDGGRLGTPEEIVRHAKQLAGEGADLLDIGGESTRPGATPVSEAEELSRVLPAIAAIREALPDLPLSIDTAKAAVARAAIGAGADVINDVWGAALGYTAEERAHWREAGRARRALPPLRPSVMARVAAELKCPLILMHHRPERDYVSFLEDVLLDLRLSLTLAHDAGVPKHQLWLDPGFGFAKSPAQNLEILRQLRLVAELGYPVLLGTSRKSTLGLAAGGDDPRRLEATAASAVWGIQQGAAMIRLHEVRELLPALRTADAIRAGLSWEP